MLYGSLYGGDVAAAPDDVLRDVSPDCSYEEGRLRIPFDLGQVIDNLRYESYASASLENHPAASFIGKGYYFFRPILPVALRRHLQKFRLNGWRHLRFPKWPVDQTVDNVHQELLLACLRVTQAKEIPFVWFWPNGASSCAIMTHDVETTLGRDFCRSLMDVNSNYGVNASFQVVPEERYEVPDRYLDEIRSRGFEVNVQDLNHDGHLFRDKQQFLIRAVKINEYGRNLRRRASDPRFYIGGRIGTMLWNSLMTCRFRTSRTWIRSGGDVVLSCRISWGNWSNCPSRLRRIIRCFTFWETTIDFWKLANRFDHGEARLDEFHYPS